MNIKKRYDLQAVAYNEASAVLKEAMNRRDLPGELSEDEEDAVREFIRDHIANVLKESANHYEMAFKQQKLGKRASTG